MTIYKILNNNLILSKDKQGHEIIVKGCGIAFQKKKGQQVDETLIEKIFTAETAQISKDTGIFCFYSGKISGFCRSLCE